MGLRNLLTRDSQSFPWEQPLPVALSLQVRSSLLLLGVWLSQTPSAFAPLLGRLRLMPAHPDWFLTALVENLVIGLVLVWLARRLAVGWALALAAIAGAVAWPTAFASLASSPLDDMTGLVRPVQETIDVALLLGTAAAFRGLVRTTRGMALASATAGAFCGLARVAVPASVWRTPWVESWRLDVAVEALSGMAFGLTLLALTTIAGHGARTVRESGTRRPVSLGLYVGAHGLAVLTLLYLQLALRFTGWSPTAAPVLLWIVGGLAAGGYAVLLPRIYAMWTASRGNRLMAPYAVLELATAPCVLCLLGSYHWVLTWIATLGLVLARALGALMVNQANANAVARPRPGP